MTKKPEKVYAHSFRITKKQGKKIKQALTRWKKVDPKASESGVIRHLIETYL